MDYKKYHRDRVYSENESLFRNIFQKRVSIIKKYKTYGKVLDIGASTGVMLDIFKDDGWETWGVEPSESTKIAKQKGHKIISDFFEKAKLANNHFDVVIMNHTLEHMDDTVLVLKKVNKVLKEDGLILVDVPNAGGIGSRVLGDKWPYRLPEEHKHQFTKESLTKIFKSSGFKVVHFESRSGIFEMANPVKEIIESLLGLKKRFFTNIIFLPYSLVATLLNMGDSMSLVGVKK